VPQRDLQELSLHKQGGKNKAKPRL